MAETKCQTTVNFYFAVRDKQLEPAFLFFFGSLRNFIQSKNI